LRSKNRSFSKNIKQIDRYADSIGIALGGILMFFQHLRRITV
jgi:hypothetical protein